MGKIVITRQQRQRLESNGSLMLPLPSLKRTPRRTYWNQYGEEIHGLPADAYHLEFYLSRGYSLSKPSHPKKRPAKAMEGLAATASETSAAELKRMRDRANGVITDESPAAAGPTATYYTPDGTPIEALPADPASMKEYLGMGFTLSAPATNVVPLRGRKAAAAG